MRSSNIQALFGGGPGPFIRELFPWGGRASRMWDSSGFPAQTFDVIAATCMELSAAQGTYLPYRTYSSSRTVYQVVQVPVVPGSSSTYPYPYLVLY